MKRVSSGTAVGNREERRVSTRERKKRYGQDCRAEIRGTLLHTHTHVNTHTRTHTFENIRTHTVRFFYTHGHGQTRRSQEETLSRTRIMEKRRDRSSKARRGSERRHWSRYFYDSNARKPDSAQRIPRPLDARSASSTIIGNGSRHRSFP